MLRGSLSSWSANTPFKKFIMLKISFFVILSYSTRVAKFVALAIYKFNMFYTSMILSHVTSHVSCVMCHVSCVTCHMSCVMCHVSCVMCHVSHVMCHVLGRNRKWYQVSANTLCNLVHNRSVNKQGVLCHDICQ